MNGGDDRAGLPVPIRYDEQHGGDCEAGQDGDSLVGEESTYCPHKSMKCLSSKNLNDPYMTENILNRQFVDWRHWRFERLVS